MVTHWHAIPLRDVFVRLTSSAAGLSELRAAEHSKKFGRNVLPQEKPHSVARLFLSQFKNPLIYIFITIVGVSAYLGHYSDVLFIVVVLLINTTVSFYQEYKANQSLLALKKMVKIKVRVLRGGYEKEIDSEHLAVGDVVIINAGDKIPADGRVIESMGLKANEAMLTGESEAIQKDSANALLPGTILPERTNMLFMGTVAEAGSAKMVVVEVGINTQMGKIVSLLKKTKEHRTPLQKKIAGISKLLGAVILFLIGVMLLIGYAAQQSFTDIFVASLALAVSAIPVGLLPAITVILVLGTRTILRKNGLVRRLSAVETIGSVTVICTDKTGTLTEGNMQVSHVLTTTKELLYEKLALAHEDDGAESHIAALRIATLVNDAFVENPQEELKEWVVRGRATDRALLMAGMQAGLDKYQLEKEYPAIDKLSFSSENKYALNLHKSGGKSAVLYALGAPEQIISRCINVDENGKKIALATAVGGVPSEGGKKHRQLSEKFELLTQKGLRVVALAHRDFSHHPSYQNIQELAKELTLVGFIALKDPLRKDAKHSVFMAQRAGIRPVIITGDHRLTAVAIAAEVGIPHGDSAIMEGKELEAITDEELEKRVGNISIYARVSPQHKLRIVNALHKNGEIVAMVGDGVNDAPALKAADIGITVGSGTDVAKEVADIVLLDDNFKTIIKAVEQGRVAFQNIRKVFIYLVADDFAEIFLFLASIVAGLPLPLLPAQILWINMVEDGFPVTALTTEQETKDIMRQAPRNPKEPVINQPLKLWIGAVFLVTGLAAFATYFIQWQLTGDVEKTRTIVFALIGFDSLLFAFCLRSFNKTIFRRDIFSNRYLVAACAIGLALLVGAIYVGPLQKILSTQPLGLKDWLWVILVSFAEIGIIEFVKKRIFVRH